jgi:hypothetical protein
VGGSFLSVFQRPAAISTDANDAQQVLCNFESMFGSHRILNGLELGGEKLDHLATLRTDHVIVMLVFVVVLVVGDAVAKPNFARETRFGEEFQRAVNGGLSDAWIFLFDETVEIFAGQMSFSAQENIENQVTLGRALETLLLNMFEENFLLFSHFAGLC